MDNSLPKLLRSAIGRPHVNPALMLCRLMVEKAFQAACETCDGSPTENARDAVLWLTARLDWTHTGLVPPEDVRREFILSFEHCCQALSLDADDVREHGLPTLTTMVHTNRHHMHMRARLNTGRNNRMHVFGLPDVYAHWERAAQRARISACQHKREQEQEMICV